MWYVINNFKVTDSKEIFLDIVVPPDSNWFCGHFPGEPILPGVAQLGMVFDAINRSEGQNFKVTGIRRVRFKQIIKPNDPLHLTIKPKKDAAGTYNVDCNGLTGSFAVKAAPAPAPAPEPEKPEPKPQTNWPLIGGIIAAVIVIALLIYFFAIRRRK